MNKHVTLLILLVATFSWSQKVEKIKGSRVVTIEKKEIDNFDAIEINDNIEVFLEMGEYPQLKIEADDNLHTIIDVELENKTLQLSTNKKATSYKKLIIRVTYTKDLNLIISKDQSVVNAIQEIQLDEITFKSLNESKLNLNVAVANFLIQSDDKSKVELNLKSENATLELSKNASLKALITSDNLNCDLYQKAKVNLEGDVNQAKIRLDNNADFIGQNLVLKNADLIAESYSNCSINSDTTLNIDASGNSEIKIYGDQKITIKRFTDAASLLKKPSR